MVATRQKSKKPSDANSTHKPPDNPVLFLDEGFGRYIIADALKEVGATVEIYSDHFKPGTFDDVWLADVASRGWIVLSKDYRIRYREPALQAIRRAGARVFVFKKTGENLTGSEMAGIFVKALSTIYRLSMQERSPFVAKIGSDGSVAIWWPERPRKPRTKPS